MKEEAKGKNLKKINKGIFRSLNIDEESISDLSHRDIKYTTVVKYFSDSKSKGKKVQTITIILDKSSEESEDYEVT